MTSITCHFCEKSESELFDMNTSVIRSPNRKHRICQNCANKISLFSIQESSKNSNNINYNLNDLTPLDIFNKISEFVLFQDDAVKCVSLATYQHIQRILGKYDGKNAVISKSNVLLAGPSGTGKTAIIKTIKNMFDFPVIETNANSITANGYHGGDVSDLIYKLYIESGEDLESTERGIIFVDEIDKIKECGGSDKDVNGSSVQESLLKIIEGTDVHLDYPDREIDVFVDTTNILFICAGAFSGIDEVYRKRTSQHSIGFGKPLQEPKENFDYSKLEIEDFSEYGFIDEFLGRLPVLAFLTKLTHDQYKEMLVKPTNSLFSQLDVLFNNEESSFSYSDRALDELVKQSMKKKLGARGAKNILSNIIDDQLFNISSSPQQSAVILDYIDDKFLITKEPLNKVSIVA